MAANEDSQVVARDIQNKLALVALVLVDGDFTHIEVLENTLQRGNSGIGDFIELFFAHIMFFAVRLIAFELVFGGIFDRFLVNLIVHDFVGHGSILSVYASAPDMARGMVGSILVLFGRTLLLSLALDVNFDGLDFNASSLGLSLNPLQVTHGELLLQNADNRRRTPEQQNASGRAPGNPEHEDRHNATHDKHLVALCGIVLDVLQNHRQKRCQSEHEHEYQIREECAETVRNHVCRRFREVGNHAVEAVYLVGVRVTNLTQRLEHGQEDRHLDEHGHAASQGIELGFSVELLHFLVLTNGVVGELLLNLLHKRLDLLHLEGRLDLLVHDRSNEQTEDNRDNDDRKTPVAKEIGEECDAIEYPVLKHVPHTALPF